MRISNMLQFTENHPFYVARFFALGNLHYTMLHSVYQPMVGTTAISLYHVLYELLPAQQVGYSPIDQQRKLFLSLQLEQGTEGRRKLLEATSKLEAVGLIHTYRSFVTEQDDYVYYYELSPPLMPHEFFASHHLVFLLRDTIGKSSLMRLRERLFAPNPLDETASHELEELTVPFYEIFRLSHDRQADDLELTLGELAAGAVADTQASSQQPAIGYSYADIMSRFPRASRNRRFVERLKLRQDQFSFINYTTEKYRLELHELCRLLDEDGVFDHSGELNEDIFTYRASLSYMQNHRRQAEREVIVQRSIAVGQESTATDQQVEERTVDERYQLEVPERFTGKCDRAQYNHMLRNEPYTGMLERFFQGKPSTHVVRLFEHIHINYKMPDEVINAMMHYIHTNKLSWSRAFVESLFTDLMAREVGSFEAAVEYMRERLKIAEKSKERGTRKGAKASSGVRSRKNAPAIVTDNVPEEPLTDEEYEQLVKEVRNIQSKLK